MEKMEVLAEQLKLPKDMALGMPLITMVGNREICVENFRKVLDYTDTCCDCRRNRTVYVYLEKSSVFYIITWKKSRLPGGLNQ